ncbi:MAG: helix-turn-helix domain-containing protein [Spirochaetes bacterium]|nr:helix-turn-helix domain-containing protein [Spirochaetota bacterium]
MKDDNELIGSAEAAKLLGIERTTLYQWTSRKLIPFVRISRNLIKFDPTELQSWIEARRIQAIGAKQEKSQPPTRQEGKPEGRRLSDKSSSEPPTRSAREKLKARSTDRKAVETKKAIVYRARAQLKEKQRRLRQARRKAAEEAIGKPDVYE